MLELLEYIILENFRVIVKLINLLVMIIMEIYGIYMKIIDIY